MWSDEWASSRIKRHLSLTAQLDVQVNSLLRINVLKSLFDLSKLSVAMWRMSMMICPLSMYCSWECHQRASSHFISTLAGNTMRNLQEMCWIQRYIAERKDMVWTAAEGGGGEENFTTVYLTNAHLQRKWKKLAKATLICDLWTRYKQRHFPWSVHILLVHDVTG